jgi:hypothetical protein
VYEAIDVELDHSGQGMHVVPVYHIEVEGDLPAPMSADDARAVAYALLRARTSSTVRPTASPTSRKPATS